jgi:hypothetical protein
MDHLSKAGSRRRFVWDNTEKTIIEPLALYAFLNSSDSYLHLPYLFGFFQAGAQSKSQFHVSGMLHVMQTDTSKYSMHTVDCSGPFLKESAFPILL